MSPRALAVALVLTGALTGCSSGSEDAAPSPSPTPSPTLSPTATPLPSDVPEDPLSPRPALESPAPVGQPTCSPDALTVTDADQVTSASTLQEVFLLRTDGRPCQLQGWPVVQLLDAAGRVLPVTPTRGGHGLPKATPAVITLTTDTTATFDVATQRSGTSCVQVAAISVTLPGTNRALRAATTLQVCDGAGVTPVQRLADDEDQLPAD